MRSAWDAAQPLDCGRSRYVQDPEHGRNCPDCKAACASYNADWRQRVRDLPIPEHLHGRPGTYTNRKCRCDRCVAAHKEMRRKIARRRRKVAAARSQRAA